MANIEDTIQSAKDKLPDITPTPPGLHAQATAHELKSRLNWGEPALTIIDVRDRAAFDACRILGATCLPLEKLLAGEKPAVEPNRDIYIYGATDDETTSAAQNLRSDGFSRVAELKGGLNSWQQIKGSVEGTATGTKPGASAYNVVSRLKEFAEEKAQESKQKRSM
ncbi:MAG: rhodanese-like domain-containing protein [Scytolyngbya sp. HA4215-MV1]|jgi:rhodanese-related sulfurtransferase|nr:rhodanese-like domain-containing protein [Scytolyngbya sp. HA4215-MV1]